jgi:hypothetical protein
MGGRIQERRIRKRGLDLEKGERILFGGEKEKPGRGERMQHLFGFFLLVDWSCWDFGLGGQEI